jgi:hypothetical protein
MTAISLHQGIASKRDQVIGTEQIMDKPEVSAPTGDTLLKFTIYIIEIYVFLFI